MDSELRHIVDTVPGFVWSAFPDGQIDFLSQVWCEYTGLELDRSLNGEWQSAVHSDDLPRLLAGWRSVPASNALVETEVRLRGGDGEFRWFLFRARPSTDASGQVVKWCGLSIDIDQRKRAEQAVAASERNLRLSIDTIPALGWSARLDGSGEFFSQYYLDYVGLSLEQARDWGWAAAVHPDDMNGLAAVWQTILASGKDGEAEARLRRHDGEYRWFLFRARPLRDEGGNIVKWYGVNIDIEDRKRAEQALSASERNLKLTIDTIPALAWSARMDGSAEFCNQHYIDYTGLSLEQLRNWGYSKAVHPDDAVELGKTYRAILASGMPGEGEARLRRHDGEYRCFVFRAKPLRDENGHPVKWYCIGYEIEDRKRAETSLANEKQLLEMIASGRALNDVLTALCKLVEDAAPGCYCGVHPIDWRGPKFEYGVAPSLPASYTKPIEGLPVSGDLIPCGVAAHQKKQVIAADLESDPRWLASSVRTHALEYGLRSVWSTPIFSNEGQVLGTFCVFHRQPATPTPHHQSLIAHATHVASIAIERSRTEAALRRSETVLAQGQRLSMTGTFSWRVDTDEVTFSDELYRIFEFDLNSVVTLEQVRARVHPEDVPALSAQMARVRAGQDYLGYEIRLRMANDRVKYLRTFGRTIRHRDGRLECLTAVQDVTERRLAEETLDKVRSELAHLTRVTSLGALTASIAHEVNQPLAGIITNANAGLRMLAADPPNIEGACETVRRTIRDGNRAADVISRLRALFSKKVATTEPVDLNEATREVLALAYGDLLRNRVKLRVEIDDDQPLLVTGDRVQLQQVVLNLIRNASDAMSEVHDRPRQMLVRAEREEDGRARLVVKDAGVGFDPQTAERLFDAFYTTKGDGMGIGLSVSRSIIESHGGKLWAEQNDGPGATFSISIPRHATSAVGEGISGAVLDASCEGRA